MPPRPLMNMPSHIYLANRRATAFVTTADEPEPPVERQNAYLRPRRQAVLGDDGYRVSPRDLAVRYCILAPIVLAGEQLPTWRWDSA